jgi:putative transposase
MRTLHYPNDIADEQWSLIEPLIPIYPGGCPRKTDTRDVVDTVFYILRTGCQWRYADPARAVRMDKPAMSY